MSANKLVGILGGGQLGQMLTMAGYPLGIKCICFDSSLEVPAALVGQVVPGDLSETEKLHSWAAHVGVVTYEFENFPAALVADLSEVRPVRPGVQALAVAQDRWSEKRLFSELKIPTTPFRTLQNAQDLRRALDELEQPLVIKTRTGGYDGKGQVVLRSEQDLQAALQLIDAGDCIAEQWVPFVSEVSIIGVRGLDGETATYPLIQNEHRNGILHISMIPAQISAPLAESAKQYMTTLLNHLDYVGVLTLEMFNTGSQLLANEMAPRVHNSGHWTIEGAETSQFENHLRAIVGLPLGSTELRGPTAMVNIIGTPPSINQVVAIPGTHLHMYGKVPRPGRKLGHITITANNEDLLQKRLAEVEAVIN